MTEHTVIHEIATGADDVWPEPHTHVSGWSPDGREIVGWQHGKVGNPIVVCGVADRRCRPLTTGNSPKWSPADDRVYFIRPSAGGGTHDLWSVALDGSGEAPVHRLGAFRNIDLFIDVSRTKQVAWAPMDAGTPQLWTAEIKLRPAGDSCHQP